MQTQNANKWERGKGAFEFGSRLRYVMSIKKISQAGLIEQTFTNLGIELNKGTMSEWFNGKKKPQVKNIVILATELGCDQHWLNYGTGIPFAGQPARGEDKKISGTTVGGDAVCRQDSENFHLATPVAQSRRVPVISWVKAGEWQEVVDLYQPGYAEDWVDADATASPGTFALVVDGDSMEPRFEDGDTIIVDPGLSPKNKDYVIAKNGDKATFKQLILDGESVLLKPLNERYQIKDMTGIEFRIIGVVVKKERRFR